MIDASARGTGEHLRDHRPYLGSMLKSDDVSNDLWCKRVNYEPKHSLISSDPCHIGRVRDDGLLVVGVFDFDGLLSSRFSAIKETERKSSTDRRKDESLPEQKV
jgi:hypothetical protein